MTKHEPDIIDEIHARRVELLAQFDYDLERFAEYVRERQKEHPERIVSKIKVVRTDGE